MATNRTARILIATTILLVWGGIAIGVDYTNTIAQVSAEITRQMSNQNIRGMSVILVDGTNTVWSSGFGYADVEANVEADADTVYHIGSCSKAFAATAVMQLCDRGLMGLDMPSTNYVTAFSMLSRFTNNAPVTVRSLLNHHCGLPGDFFNGMVTTRANDGFTDWLTAFLSDDYAFAPVNERGYYSNSGFVLVSEAVAQAAGTDFASFVNGSIFEPLGMSATSFLPDKPAITGRLAACYDYLGERMPPEFVNCLGSGSMYSSMNDLGLYMKMILAQGVFNGVSVLSSNAIDVMVAPQHPELPLNIQRPLYGLGWDGADDYRFAYAGKVFWKGGATYCHCAVLVVSRDLQLGVAVAQNGPGSACDDIGLDAMKLAILDKHNLCWPTNTLVPPEAPVTSLPQDELDVLSGLYVGASGYSRIDTVEGSLIWVDRCAPGSTTIVSNLVPRANGWYSTSNSMDMQLAFTNLAGHDMLVKHQVSGSYDLPFIVGARYVPGLVPSAWLARTNKVYRMVDMHPYDYMWSQEYPKRLLFEQLDGAMLVQWMFGWFVIDPQDDCLAFQQGTHYRKGGAVQVTETNGFELVRFGSYRFIDESSIPLISVPSSTNGTIPVTSGTQWYRFEGQSGQTYRVSVRSESGCLTPRITDDCGIAFCSGTNGLITWKCSVDDICFLAVSATGMPDFEVSVALCDGAHCDYDGDNISDLAVYRKQSGGWYLRSVAGNVMAWNFGWGASGMTPVPGDYDGDGISDLAVYDEDVGTWYVRTMSGAVIAWALTWGGPGMAAVTGDYDGDRRADLAVYSEATGRWYVKSLNDGVIAWNLAWGGPGLIAVPGDFNGDCFGDLAVYDGCAGLWYVRTRDGDIVLWAQLFGGAAYTPVSGDYDGDGISDLAVYHEDSGTWYIMTISGELIAWALAWGGRDMIPVSGDYDGDGICDPAVYDTRNGAWYVRSVSGRLILWNSVWGGVGFRTL